MISFQELNKFKMINKDIYNNINVTEIKNIHMQEHEEEKKPIFSIIIPTYNRYDQLIQCINSVLSQTLQSFEIIIMDDMSTDARYSNLEKAKDKRIKYIKNSHNLGIGKNRQSGFKISRGKYIIFIDDDDYFIDYNYFKTLNKIFKDKNIKIICSNCLSYYEDRNLYEFNILNLPQIIDNGDYLKKFQMGYEKPTSVFPMALRRNTAVESGFNEMEMMNDSCIYLRALTSTGSTYYNDNFVGIYRIHGGNETSNPDPKFIILNLEEKKKIYNNIVNTKNINLPKNWFNKQTEITVNHIINGNPRNVKNINMVLNWVKENNTLVLFYKLKVKSFIKRFIYENKKFNNK